MFWREKVIAVVIVLREKAYPPSTKITVLTFPVKKVKWGFSGCIAIFLEYSKETLSQILIVFLALESIKWSLFLLIWHWLWHWFRLPGQNLKMLAQHYYKTSGHFLRLNRNRKPRMKSLWHPGGCICIPANQFWAEEWRPLLLKLLFNKTDEYKVKTEKIARWTI